MHAHNPVKMVRHDDERVQFNAGTDFGRPKPFLLDYLTENTKRHLPVRDVAEDALAPLGDNRHEIRACLRVIVRREADGPPIVLVWIVIRHRD